MPNKYYALFVSLAFLFSLACSGGSSPTDPGDNGNGNGNGGGPPPPAAPKWVGFGLDSLLTARAASGNAFLHFLDKEFVDMGIYVLAKDDTDERGVQSRDETYYIVEGNAKITVGSQDQDVAPGKAFYFDANTSKVFHTITEDLLILVTSSKRTPSAGGLSWEQFGMDTMTSTRDGNRVVWNQFLTRASIVLGMYMIPQAVGQDNAHTHTFGELVYVVNGTGRFTTGTKTFDISPGSIVYAEDGVNLHFNSLSSDTDILIWWEFKN